MGDEFYSLALLIKDTSQLTDIYGYLRWLELFIDEENQ